MATQIRTAIGKLAFLRVHEVGSGFGPPSDFIDVGVVIGVHGAQGGFFTLPDGRRGAMLRAYDKATGADAGAIYMPAPQTGSPMTYMLGGKQYLVLSISGAGFPAEIVAYTVPNQ